MSVLATKILLYYKALAYALTLQMTVTDSSKEKFQYIYRICNVNYFSCACTVVACYTQANSIRLLLFLTVQRAIEYQGVVHALSSIRYLILHMFSH